MFILCSMLCFVVCNKALHNCVSLIAQLCIRLCTVVLPIAMAE